MRRALIVGIDEYPECPLQGCVNDAVRLEGVLSKHHDCRPNFQCEVITSPSTSITRPILRQKISELFKDEADIAFLHFSGHGTVNGLGGYLVTTDFTDYDVGIPMTEILAMANASPVHERFITLDCCHSGAFGLVPAVTNDKVFLSEGVSVITATRPGQQALEEGGGGVFTSLLVEALDGGAAGLLGEVTAASLYAYIDNALGAWDQRPLFRSNVSRLVQLREAAPRIDRSLLQRITEFFPLPAEELPLSPNHEPSAEPHDDDKETRFRDLIRLRHAGLVEPNCEEDMYYAAMNSRSCSLTTLGRYYWRLVSDNKI